MRLGSRVRRVRPRTPALMTRGGVGTFGSTEKPRVGFGMAADDLPRHTEREFNAERLPKRALTRAAAWTAAGAVVLLAAGYFWLYASILPYPFEPYGFPGGILISVSPRLPSAP